MQIICLLTIPENGEELYRRVAPQRKRTPSKLAKDRKYFAQRPPDILGAERIQCLSKPSMQWNCVLSHQHEDNRAGFVESWLSLNYGEASVTHNSLTIADKTMPLGLSSLHSTRDQVAVGSLGGMKWLLTGLGPAPRVRARSARTAPVPSPPPPNHARTERMRSWRSWLGNGGCARAITRRIARRPRRQRSRKPGGR